MTIKYPRELDGDAELYEPQDGIDEIVAAHHNALKDAIKALEEKVGVDASAVTSSIDYKLNNVAVPSDPPSGKEKVVNIYFDQSTQEQVIISQ